MSHGNVRSYTHKVSPTWVPKCALKKYSNHRYSNVDVGAEAPTLHRELQAIKKDWEWKQTFPREEHTNLLFNNKWSSHEKIHTSNIIQALQLYFCIYINCGYTLKKNNEKRSHELEKGPGGLWHYGGRKAKGRKYVTVLESQEIKEML